MQQGWAVNPLASWHASRCSDVLHLFRVRVNTKWPHGFSWDVGVQWCQGKSWSHCGEYSKTPQISPNFIRKVYLIRGSQLCWPTKCTWKSLYGWKLQACTKEGWWELWESVSGQNEKFLWESQDGVGADRGMQACVRSAAAAIPAVMFVSAPPTTVDSCHFMNTEPTIKENYYNQNNKYFILLSWGSVT